MWTLVKLKKGEREWLLIKERDGYVTPGGRQVPEGSVLSGLTVEDVKAGTDLETPLLAALGDELRRPASPVHADDGRADAAEPPTSRSRKDGLAVRAQARRLSHPRGEGRGARCRLRSRNGDDLTRGFPEIDPLAGRAAVRPPGARRRGRGARRGRPPQLPAAAAAGPAAPAARYAPGRGGAPRHAVRLRPAGLRGPRPAAAAALAAEGAAAEGACPAVGALRYLDHSSGKARRFFAEVERLGLEGMVAKRADAPYRGGPLARLAQDRAARRPPISWSSGSPRPRGAATRFGALHLAQYVDGKLRYAGRVGSGLRRSGAGGAPRRARGRAAEAAACHRPIPRTRRARSGSSRAGCARCEFTEWTEDGLLRQPVFLRLRDDKRPEECGDAARRLGHRALGRRGRGRRGHPTPGASASNRPTAESPSRLPADQPRASSSGPPTATPRAT